MTDQPLQPSVKGLILIITIIGGAISGLLGLWVQNVTMDLRDMIKQVTRTQAVLEAHVSGGHPYTVRNEIQDLRGEISRLGSDILVIKSRLPIGDER